MRKSNCKFRVSPLTEALYPTPLISRDFSNPLSSPIIILLNRALYVPQKAELSLESPTLEKITSFPFISTPTLP